MTVGLLRQKYQEGFGEESRSNHKRFLFRRIAWRIQAPAEGGPPNARAVARWKLLTMQSPWSGPTVVSHLFTIRWDGDLESGSNRPARTKGLNH